MISVKTGIINLIFDFFAKISNLHLIIESMVMPIKEDDTTFGFLKYIIWIFMAVGFLTAVFEREKKGFVIFSIISFLI